MMESEENLAFRAKADSRDEMRSDLLTISTHLSLSIEPQRIENILEQDSGDCTDHRYLHEYFERIIEKTPIIDDIYIMVRSDSEFVWRFLVAGYETTDRDGDGAISVDERAVRFGEEYDVSAYPEMRLAFEGPIVDSDLTTDKWGTFLSGYAPIMNGTEPVAIVGVDIRADSIMEQERTIDEHMEGALSRLRTQQNITTGKLFISAIISFVASCVIILILSNIIFSKTIRSLENRNEINTKKIRDSEEKYRTIVEQSLDNIYLCDGRSHKILESNRSLQRLLGYSADELRNMTVHDFIDHPREDIEEKIRGMSKNGILKLEERIYRRRDGRRVEVMVNASHLKLKGRELICVVSRDISEIIRMNRNLAEERNKAEFYLDLFTHDIANLHHAMLGYIEIYGSLGKDKVDTHLILSNIHHLLKRGIFLTRNITIFSKAKSSPVQLNDTEICEIIDSSIKQVEIMFPDQEIEIKRKGCSDPIHIKAEPLLEQVFVNILHNAIKFQEGKKTVEIDVDMNGKKVIIDVADHGMGVKDDRKSDLFRRFERSGNKDQSGIGLAVVKVLVDRYNGQIEVMDRIERDHSKGLKIRLIFPII